jgi:hypothetical protein
MTSADGGLWPSDRRVSRISRKLLGRKRPAADPPVLTATSTSRYMGGLLAGRGAR